ncbi:MAG: DNA polymerase Y family protein, partial [Halieaceae bacterium]|nr:DNA polymerase Y family protein [Halieaceae bacterium]
KLYWKDELHLISGPERIEDYWWSKPISRDYYIAKNIYGNHYWIFCNRRTKHWYIQGIFP